MLEYGKEPGTWMRILIVDDDALQRRLLRAQLNKGGHEIWEVTDGAAAWELWQEQPIQLVITDWMMPRMDGVELTRRIRAASTSAYTYIIMLTGRSDRNDIVDGLESGADDYLVKPFDPRELLSRVAIGMRIINLEMRLRESLHELHRMATHDSLTGVFNRHAIYEYASVEVARTQREVMSVSLILIDVDHFKNINDTYGHPAGDQALRMVATTLRRLLRPYDRVGRWGGEEFLLVLPGTTLEEAGEIAERVRATIERTGFSLTLDQANGEGELRLQVSQGVASASAQEPHALETLIDYADQALYQAKRGGRNQVRLYSPSPSAV
jgi:two-component system chemotaxis response regulator CheY